LGRKIAVLLGVFIVSSFLFVHSVFAHNFVQDSNADLIAKIQEFKVESNLIASNISNTTLAQWHITKSQEYWGSNEMNGLSQKNSTLQNNLSTAIDDLYSLSGQSNVDPNVAAQKANVVNQLMDQVESEEVSSAVQSNATIQSLATVNVLNEVLRDYGMAIGSTVDLTNMSNMNMNSTTNSSSGMNMGSSSSSGSISGMSGNMQGMPAMSSAIVNDAAYQSVQALTDTAQSMFNNLRPNAPSSASSYLDKINSALGELKQAINSKESGNDVMMVVHMKIHPNFISAFNIQKVPEFPIPTLLVVISFIAIISISIVFPRLH